MKTNRFLGAILSANLIFGMNLSASALNSWVNTANTGVINNNTTKQVGNVIGNVSSSTGMDLGSITKGLDIFNGVLGDTFGVLQGSADYLKGSEFGRAADLCYGGGSLGAVPNVNLNICNYLNNSNGKDVCSSLPNIPGMNKKTQAGDKELSELAEYCNSFYKDSSKPMKDSTVAKKDIKNKIVDLKASDEDLTYKTLKDSTTKNTVYKTNVAGVDNVSGISYFDKTTNTTVAPLTNIVNQEDEVNKEALSYYSRLAEKTNGDATSASSDIKTAVFNAKKINVSYSNMDEYIEDREKIIERLISLESELEKFNDTLRQTVLVNLQDINKANLNNVAARQNKTNSFREKLIKDYESIIEKWIDIKTKHYHSFNREGFVVPTKDMVDRMAYKGEEAIVRAATVNKINKQINEEARDISEFHIKGMEMRRKFITLLDKTIIMSQVFNEGAAKQAVGL